MLLMVDNYDSFTYNIVQYFGELNQEVKVVRNDAVTLEDIERWQPKYLVIGPGPCSPSEAGISIPAIQHFAGKSKEIVAIGFQLQYFLCPTTFLAFCQSLYVWLR